MSDNNNDEIDRALHAREVADAIKSRTLAAAARLDDKGYEPIDVEQQPDKTLQMLVHLCHVADWQVANHDISNDERLTYYEDIVTYVRAPQPSDNDMITVSRGDVHEVIQAIEYIAGRLNWRYHDGTMNMLMDGLKTLVQLLERGSGR